MKIQKMNTDGDYEDVVEIDGGFRIVFGSKVLSVYCEEPGRLTLQNARGAISVRPKSGNVITVEPERRV